ncbi:hypothetical protein PVAND_009426 [Polypedilum vanderplanki]|uniref:SH3 domain-containing protein n=1 Tax=Polypedilum vanderplanki TaxID=319348 RepID=A0A9J6CCJ5_POLVA|nr:hypothetical protein PVAND_009426 [Polypedilum vanderplanki]
MKYATRPAPPPPSSGVMHQHQQPQQFPPVLNSNTIKPKPPRPPPPKQSNDTINNKTQSMKLFSNLFGASKKNNINKSNEKLSQMEVKLPPPRLPMPPINNRHHHNTTTVTPVSQVTNDLQLINFDVSPPASPVSFIKKSNTGGSDSVSMDSFCSSNSSPNNLGFNSGTTSQAESGFEDDFSVSDFKVSSRAASRSTTFSNDPFELLDDFSSSASTPSTGLPRSNMHANIRNMKPTIQPKPVSIGNTNFFTSNLPSAFDDSSNSNKNVTKVPAVSMPTIIKPASLTTNRKPSPTHVPSLQIIKPIQPAYQDLESTSDESYEEPPSPPMPTIPAPVLVLDENNDNDDDDEEKESYRIALYDFESDVTEDLNFRANEKIYLMQQMNDEWMYGRNKRGCEGIFPINYIDIKVPLKNPQSDSGTASRSESVSPSSHRVRVLYTFNAETDEDLTIKENDFVNVLYEINSEWLYGSNSNGEYGQFPANFIEFIPQHLPSMPK